MFNFLTRLAGWFWRPQNANILASWIWALVVCNRYCTYIYSTSYVPRSIYGMCGMKFICIYIYTYTHTYTYTFSCTCTCRYTYTYTYTCTILYLYLCIYIYLYILIVIYIYIIIQYIDIRIRIYTYTYSYNIHNGSINVYYWIDDITIRYGQFAHRVSGCFSIRKWVVKSPSDKPRYPNNNGYTPIPPLSSLVWNHG